MTNKKGYPRQPIWDLQGESFDLSNSKSFIVSQPCKRGGDGEIIDRRALNKHKTNRRGSLNMRMLENFLLERSKKKKI